MGTSGETKRTSLGQEALDPDGRAWGGVGGVGRGVGASAATDHLFCPA